MVRPIVRRFDIEVGHCSPCRRRVQGRHRLQCSDALGAAGVQLGPEVVALVVRLHTHLGVPLAKVTHLLRTQFGLTITPGGLAQVRVSPVVTPDETGWPVGAMRHWLWVFATPQTTVYAIRAGRGFDDCRLQAKIGELLMETELLYAKVDQLEAGRPLARRRSTQ